MCHSPASFIPGKPGWVCALNRARQLSRTTSRGSSCGVSPAESDPDRGKKEGSRAPSPSTHFVSSACSCSCSGEPHKGLVHEFAARLAESTGASLRPAVLMIIINNGQAAHTVCSVAGHSVAARCLPSSCNVSLLWQYPCLSSGEDSWVC